MKKLLVVLLALTFVVAMATAAFAVATSSVDGKVEWTWQSAGQMGGTDDGKLSFDLAKDFGEGYSAGLKIKITPNGEDAPNQFDEVKYDGNGFIKMVKDFGTLTFQTGGLNGNAANELGKEYDMAGNPGIKFESSALMEGLAFTAVLNENNDYYNYLVKGVYTADPLTVGLGYQAHTVAAGVHPTANDMMAVWAGYKLSDAINLGFEYGSRPNVDGNGATGSTAIMVKADYTAAPLTVNGKVQIQTGAYKNIADGDVGTMSAFNKFQSATSGTAVKVDASYQVTDALKAYVNLEDILSGAKNANVELTSKQLMSYKVGVTDVLNDKLTADAWYAGYGDSSELGVKGTYTFVAGLVGSLELKSNTTAPAAAVNSYTAKVTATL